MLLACLIGLLAPHRIVGLDGLSTLEDSRASSQEELPAEEEQNTPSVRYNSQDRCALLCNNSTISTLVQGTPVSVNLKEHENENGETVREKNDEIENNEGTQVPIGQVDTPAPIVQDQGP